ncbi:MAG: hypothetical protein QXU69_03350 [Thermofilaceae archaeon]
MNADVYLTISLLLLLVIFSLSILYFYSSMLNNRVKYALIIGDSFIASFQEYLKDYEIVKVSDEEAEILVLNITMMLYNFSFYAPITVLFDYSGNIEGVIIGRPSKLFWEEIKSCVGSLNCTPFLAYATHLPRCDFCPSGGFDERIETLTILPREKIDKLIAIVKTAVKKE